MRIEPQRRKERKGRRRESWNWLFFSYLCALCVFAVASAVAAEAPDGPSIPIAKLDRADAVDFEREVLPMLRASCLACHNRTRAKADLVLETPADIRKGSANGPVLVPGKADDSLLLQVCAHRAKPVMPPKDNKASAPDLTPDQLALLRLWINQGATGEVRNTATIHWQAPAASLQPIYAVALTNDGHYAAAGRGNQIDVYDLAAQRYAVSLVDPHLGRAPHRDLVDSLAFSPDGTMLASGAFGEVKLWRRSPAARELWFVTPAAGAVAAAARRVAVSPDGQSVAVAAEGWPIELFEAATGRATGTLAASTSAPTAVAFSPDGHQIAIASVDGGLRISDVATGSLLAQTVIPGGAASLAWVDAHTLASGGGDGVVRVGPVPDAPGTAWPAPREWKAGAGAITCLATLPGSGDLLTAGADGFIRQWHAGQKVREVAAGSPVVSLAVRPDGKAFASIGKDGPPRLWDAAKPTPIAELKGDPAADRQASLRDRDQKAAAADVAYCTATTQRSDTERKAAAERVKTATAAKATAEKASAAAVAVRDKAAATKAAAEKALAAAQEAIRAATTQATAAEQSLKGAQKATTQPFDPALAAQVKAAADAKAKVQHLTADAKPKQAADEAAKALAAAEAQIAPTTLTLSNAQTELKLAIDADARSAAALDETKASLARARQSLQAADARLATAKESAAAASAAPTRWLAFSPDGSTLATAAPDGHVRLWSPVTGLPVDTLTSTPRDLAGVAFAGDRLLIASAEGCDLWSLGGGWSLVRTIGAGDAASSLTDRVNALAFSPDGRLLATGSGEPTRSGQVKLWDVSTGQLVRDVKDLHSDAVLALEFSPDGRQLASGSADRLAKVTDVASGQVLHTLEGHTAHVLGLSWKFDGRTLATCSADRQVKLWDAVTGDKRNAIAGFAKDVESVRFLGVTDQLAAAPSDGQFRIVNEAGATVRPVAGAKDFLQAAAATPDGHLLATGDENGLLLLWRDPGAPPTMSFEVPDRK